MMKFEWMGGDFEMGRAVFTDEKNGAIIFASGAKLLMDADEAWTLRRHLDQFIEDHDRRKTEDKTS